MTKAQRTAMRKKAVLTEARRLGISLDTPTRGRSQEKAVVKEAVAVKLMEGPAREREVSKAQRTRTALAHEALGSKLGNEKRTKFANMGEASDYWRLTLAPVLAKHNISIR